MTPETEEYYLQWAAANPDALCSEISPEILELCAADAEPTAFIEEFLTAGHTQWLLRRYRRRLPPQQVNNNILRLWLRACRLNTSRLTGAADPDWNKPFFSVEDLG